MLAEWVTEPAYELTVSSLLLAGWRQRGVLPPASEAYHGVHGLQTPVPLVPFRMKMLAVPSAGQL